MVTQHCFWSLICSCARLREKGLTPRGVFIHRHMEHDPLHVPMLEHLVICRRGLPLFFHKEEGRELSWWVQIGDVGRWGTLTVV